MKTKIFMSAFLTSLVALFLLSTNVQAQPSNDLSAEHKQHIVANCTTAITSLNRIHRSDASLRVNRGQLYEFTSTKLMAHLNGRLALNSFDASNLVKITSQYDTTLKQFRSSYKTYEETLTQAKKTDCKSDPQSFLKTVDKARQARQEVARAASQLNQQARQYYQAFDKFKESYRLVVEDIIP